MILKLKDPVQKITGSNSKPMDTSYETICDVERIAPRNAYRELLDHPLKIIPYTPMDDTAKIYKIATF
jgi:hypothetical protein